MCLVVFVLVVAYATAKCAVEPKAELTNKVESDARPIIEAKGDP